MTALIFDPDGSLDDTLSDLRAARNEMHRGLARRERGAFFPQSFVQRGAIMDACNINRAADAF